MLLWQIHSDQKQEPIFTGLKVDWLINRSAFIYSDLTVAWKSSSILASPVRVLAGSFSATHQGSIVLNFLVKLQNCYFNFPVKARSTALSFSYQRLSS